MEFEPGSPLYIAAVAAANAAILAVWEGLRSLYRRMRGDAPPDPANQSGPFHEPEDMAAIERQHRGKRPRSGLPKCQN